jgi:hypothetical protein
VSATFSVIKHTHSVEIEVEAQALRRVYQSTVYGYGQNWRYDQYDAAGVRRKEKLCKRFLVLLLQQDW